jgi:hypothetical protein
MRTMRTSIVPQRLSQVSAVARAAGVKPDILASYAAFRERSRSASVSGLLTLGLAVAVFR